MFLHGYTTAWPASPTWLMLLAAEHRPSIEVTTPVAPSGVSRRDAFNPRGKPSWFRYSTDLSGAQPQQFDRPDEADLAQVVFGTGDAPRGGSLWSVLERAVEAAGGADGVALAGESQGGVVAAYLGVRWNRLHPTDQLGALSLIRTAVDPVTWATATELNGVAPPRFVTRIHVVLGAADTVFHPAFSLHSLVPMLHNNRVRTGDVPAPYRHPDGNVTVEVLDGVGHADHNRQVYRTVVRLLVRDWPAGRP